MLLLLLEPTPAARVVFEVGAKTTAVVLVFESTLDVEDTELERVEWRGRELEPTGVGDWVFKADDDDGRQRVGVGIEEPARVRERVDEAKLGFGRAYG